MDDYRIKLIEIAHGLAGGGLAGPDDRLRWFRVYYQHLAATVDAAHSLGKDPLQQAKLEETEKALVTLHNKNK